MMVYNGDIIKKRMADMRSIHRYLEARLGSSGAGAAAGAGVTPATTRGGQLSRGGVGGGGVREGRKGTGRRRIIGRDSHVRDADGKVGA